jgi:exosortase
MLFISSLLLLSGDALVIEESFLAMAILLFITGTLKLYFNEQGFQNCLFPLLLLIFCIPLPETIARHILHIHLQKLSAITSSGILAILGYESNVTGAVIFINDLRINVIEACSGLNAVISFLFISLLIAKFKFPKMIFYQSALIAGGILSALLSNIIRLFAAGIIAAEYGINTMNRFIHSWSVLIIYLGGILFILIITAMLKELQNTRIHKFPKDTNE